MNNSNNFISSWNIPAPYIPQTLTGVRLVTDTVESKLAQYSPKIFNGTKHSIKFFRFIDGNNTPLSTDSAVCYDRKKKGYCIRPDISVMYVPVKEIPVNQPLTCMESKLKVFSTENGALPILQHSANCTSTYPEWTNYDIIIGSEYWVDNVTKMPEYSYMEFKDRLYVPIPLFRTSDDKEPIGTYALKKRFLYNPADYFRNGVDNFSRYHILECLYRYKNSNNVNNIFSGHIEYLEKWVMQPFLKVNR